MPLLSPAIIWAIVGVVLIIAELFTASFVLVFFGIAALLVAGATALGLTSFVLQMLLFSLFSLASLLLFRKKLMGNFNATAQTVMDEKQVLILEIDIPIEGTAQVNYQGSVWTAVNLSGYNLAKGEKAVITRIEGVKLVLGRNS